MILFAYLSIYYTNTHIIYFIITMEKSYDSYVSFLKNCSHRVIFTSLHKIDLDLQN